MINTSRIRRNARQLRLQAARAQSKNRAAEIVKNSFRPIFSFYPDNHIDELRERSFRLLETHGVAIEHEEAVKLLTAAGATQTSDGKCYRLPRQLIKEALATTPKTVELCAHDPVWDLQLPRADGTFVMRTGTGAYGFVDADSGDYRNLKLEDVGIIARLSNHLDQIGFVAHPFVADVPAVTADIHGVARLVTQTQKHVMLQPYAFENIEYLMRIVATAAGGEEQLRQRPIASCIVTSFTPLAFKRMDVEAIRQAACYGLPIHACSLPSAAGTAPITMPGVTVMAAAEILAMVVMAHLFGANIPVIATPLIFSLDVRTGRCLQSSVEVLQGVSMAVQLMKYGFGLVTHTIGVGSDTPAPCPQAQAEAALRAQLTSLSGADILGGVGQLECATVFSPIQAILDNELGGMLNRYLQASPVDDESTAWEVLKDIELGGNFLAQEHTVRHCRNMFMPKVFQREDRDSYEANNRRDVMDSALESYLEIMQRPLPDSVPSADQRREIEQIVRAADADILADT
ncbi:MAG: trimethylamine methyltransferase family protein [Acidiferrobacterales bacterium]